MEEQIASIIKHADETKDENDINKAIMFSKAYCVKDKDNLDTDAINKLRQYGIKAVWFKNETGAGVSIDVGLEYKDLIINIT